MLDVSMPSPTRAMVAATALVTPAALGDLEVRAAAGDLRNRSLRGRADAKMRRVARQVVG